MVSAIPQPGQVEPAPRTCPYVCHSLRRCRSSLPGPAPPWGWRRSWSTRRSCLPGAAGDEAAPLPPAALQKRARGAAISQCPCSSAPPRALHRTVGGCSFQGHAGLLRVRKRTCRPRLHDDGCSRDSSGSATQHPSARAPPDPPSTPEQCLVTGTPAHHEEPSHRYAAPPLVRRPSQEIFQSNPHLKSILAGCFVFFFFLSQATAPPAISIVKKTWLLS